MPERSATKATGREKDRTHAFTLRDAVHTLVVLGGWTLFFVWWGEVVQSTSIPEAAFAVLVILAVSLLTALATIGWVRYNLGIYRRKGPRLRIPDVREECGSDVLGREYVHPGVETLRAARVVTVSPAGGTGKSLSPGSG